jgi:hypothetical protein
MIRDIQVELGLRFDVVVLISDEDLVGRERWAFNTLPGFQHVQVLRNKVTKALGFALKPQFIQEEVS